MGEEFDEFRHEFLHLTSGEGQSYAPQIDDDDVLVHGVRASRVRLRVLERLHELNAMTHDIIGGHASFQTRRVYERRMLRDDWMPVLVVSVHVRRPIGVHVVGVR